MLGGNWVTTITSDVADEEQPLDMAQPPRPGAAQGLVAVGEADGLADADAGAAEAADDPSAEEEDQGQHQEEAQRAGRVQRGEDRLRPEEADVGFEEGGEPGDQPPQGGDHRNQDDQALARVGIALGEDAPEPEGEDDGVLGVAVEPDGAFPEKQPGLVEPADEGQGEGGHGQGAHPGGIKGRLGVLAGGPGRPRGADQRRASGSVVWVMATRRQGCTRVARR